MPYAGHDIPDWLAEEIGARRTYFEVEAQIRPGCAVLAVDVLLDGRVVAGCADNAVRIFDRRAGCVQTLIEGGHTDKVLCVKVLPGGQHVISGSVDTTLKRWDTSSPARRDGRCLATLSGHMRYVRCCCVLEDGRLVSGTGNEDTGEIKCWHLGEGRILWTNTLSTGTVYCCAALTGSRFVTGSLNGRLMVWEDSHCVKSLRAHADEIYCVVALPCGKVVSGCFDGSIKLWDLNDKPRRVLMMNEEEEDSEVQAIAVLPDGKIVSGSQYGGGLKCWDLEQPHFITQGMCVQDMSSGGVLDVATLPDGRIVSAHGNGITVWLDQQRLTEKIITKQLARQRVCGDVVKVIAKYL